MHRILFSLLIFSACVSVSGLSGFGQELNPGTTEVIISIADQRLAVVKDGGLVAKYPISTSRFGVGDGRASYKTPLGRLRVCDKVGDGLCTGAVLKHRQATGEVLPANAPGRDPIVTRILWLNGEESQNANARERGIYIHGTTEENQIGRPVSYGCIRMRSRDVLFVYNDVPLGASVNIVPGKLPRLPKYVPPPPQPPQMLVAKQTTPASGSAAAPTQAPTPSPTVSPVQPVTTKPILATANSGAQAARTAPDLIMRSRSTGQTTHLSGEMAAAMKGSILNSGLAESGNSEIPRLRQ